MNYPFWDVGIGYGYLMAAMAVVHVFVSHFAIGGGLYLVVTEARARRRNDQALLAYLPRLSRFFVLLTLVTGAITGVGIWFVIGLISPAATEALIHHFVWFWAIEWTFFVVEIASAILYYYGWTRLSARNHLIIGWIYFIAAWLSLVVINGIVGFMLTPGEWLKTGEIWTGFFNPTYWGSLVFRTGICIMLAGLVAMLVASREKTPEAKSRIARYNAGWALVGLLIIVPSYWLYWTEIPSEIVKAVGTMMPSPQTYLCMSVWLMGVIAALVVVLGIIFSRRLHLVSAILLMICGMVFFGSFEWFRESVRKPFVIYGYQYGNGIDLADEEQIRADGLLSHIAYRTGNDGADLFRRACRSCHTINGYKALKPVLDGTDPAFISGVIGGAHKMRGNMPPFFGTDSEAKAIAQYLYQYLDHRPLSQTYGVTGAELGKKVYAVRCGKCHVIGGFNDKSETIAGATDDDYATIKSSSGEFSEFMPAWSGSDEEWDAMVQYLKTLKAGGANATSGL
jgi:mono/diheme cytochrome c family protein/cytochrome bd-type quinol oxidase subunit 1